MNNRTAFDIKCDILSLLETAGPQKPTHVMYKATLSYAQLTRYLASLESNGLISKNEENRWTVSTKGLEMMPILEEVCA